MSVPPATATAPQPITLEPKTTSAASSSTTSTSNAAPARSTKGLTFTANFSTPGVSPFDDIEWSNRTAEITDDSGGIMFRQENVEVPASWSELSTKIAVSKYFYGAQDTDEREYSVRQLIHRVSRTVADWGLEDGYFASEEDAEAFYDEVNQNHLVFQVYQK